MVLEKRGYHFETETDTEAVAVLCKYIYDSQPTKRLTFTSLIKAVIKELVRTLCPSLHTHPAKLFVRFFRRDPSLSPSNPPTSPPRS